LIRIRSGIHRVSPPLFSLSEAIYHVLQWEVIAKTFLYRGSWNPIV
jgi:hypothetical protein